MSVVSVNHEQKRYPVSVVLVVSVNHEQRRDPRPCVSGVSGVSNRGEILCQWCQWCQ